MIFNISNLFEIDSYNTRKLYASLLQDGSFRRSSRNNTPKERGDDDAT